MRIVLDLQACQTFGSKNRGIGRYSMALSQAMARQARGHEILIALNGSFPDTIDTIRKSFDGLVHKDNIRVFNVVTPINELNPENTWRARTAELVRENFLAGLSPDIVHVSSLFEGPEDDAVTSGGNADGAFDTAITLYDLIPLLNKEIYLSHPLIRDWYYRKLQGLKKAQLLLSISEHSRQEAISALHLPADQVVNISSAVDPVFRPRILSIEELASLRNRYGFSKPFLMYTGGIDHRKNIEGLIQAFAALPGDIRAQYQLAVVCSINDPSRRRLESLAAQCGLEKTDVVITGYVPEEDLVRLYNACALFVFPSLHEGFGLPVLEAMCCGAAVIGSNTSSIPEVLGREDALFNPRDVLAIADKIHTALTDEDFKTSLQRHGPQQAKQFSWDLSAQRAWEAFEHQHEIRRQTDRVSVAVRKQRPRLAYLSPLPPEKSGIADYSAELLPELARHYDIDVVVAQSEVTHPWLSPNFPVRTVEWFSAHAADYDRILYHFGNSEFHRHMFDLLERHPGVVVLHDFFMSGILEFADYTGTMPGAFDRALYESHGYPALIAHRRNGRQEAKWKYPCNKRVLDNALGVIVHSRFSFQLAEQWYGEGAASSWKLIPLLRALPEKVDRASARRQLELSDDDFLVCSFGLLGPTKLNQQLLDAWLDSPLCRDKRCRLVFVGENQNGDYGRELSRKIAASGCKDRIKITGFASQELYRNYLAASDAAVQLRTKSRGETSAAVFDCMAYGIPTIVNTHGSAADLPDDVLIKLPDEFPVSRLADALVSLRKDSEGNRTLGKRAIEYLRVAHHPAHIGDMYRDGIEQFSTESPGSRYQRLVRSIAAVAAPVQPSAQDLAAAAASIVTNQPARKLRQILVDVSGLMRPDTANNGQWLVRTVLDALLNEERDGYRVEPVYAEAGRFKYARRFTLSLIGASDLQMEDTLVDACSGDLLLGLDTAPDASVQQELASLRHRGVGTISIALSPLHQAAHLKETQAAFTEWLGEYFRASKFACVSRIPENGLPGHQAFRSAARNTARRQSGWSDSDFVVCIFGTRGSQQIDDRFLKAWLKSPFSTDERHHLVFFVSEQDIALATEKIRITGNRRIHIASNISAQARHAYLKSVDAALLLQPDTDDIAPAAIVDCLAYGIPAIVGEGTTTVTPIVSTLLQLRNGLPDTDHDKQDIACTMQSASRVLGIYREYLEQIASRPQDRSRGTNAPGLRGLAIPAAAASPAAQILVDITFLARHNLNSGIQRVVHHVLAELLAVPPQGYRVEPVYDAGGYYAYARRFAAGAAGAQEQRDDPIAVSPGDMFLGLDLSPNSVRENRQVFDDFRNHGVQVFFVVYDLLPLLRPEVFPANAQAIFVEWFEAVVTIADGLIGISRTVADEIAEWLAARQPARAQPLPIGYFHLGANVADEPSGGNAHETHERPSILMVGTVEPRKGHAQTLSAFEKLWEQGIDVDLVIVGRQGWMVESLMARLRTHPEHGRRLFWFEGASDEMLLKLYETSSALLLASEGEGFGLPLIEAARHKLPIIARDLPVFREVAGEHAFYFNGTTDDALYDALGQWLALYSGNRAPSPEGIRWLTWAESAQQLLDVVVGQNWYRDRVHRAINTQASSA